MLQLLDLIPKWVWAALVAALAATSCKLKIENGNLTLEIEKHATHIAQLQNSILAANEAAATDAARYQAEKANAVEASRKREKIALADAASAKSELDGLRAVLQPRLYSLTAKAAAAAPSANYTDPLPDLLLQCSARYIDLAAKADGHVNDIKTLVDAWPK